MGPHLLLVGPHSDNILSRSSSALPSSRRGVLQKRSLLWLLGRLQTIEQTGDAEPQKRTGQRDVFHRSSTVELKRPLAGTFDAEIP